MLGSTVVLAYDKKFINENNIVEFSGGKSIKMGESILSDSKKDNAMTEQTLKNARVVLSFIERNMDLSLIKRLKSEDLDAIRFIVKAEAKMMLLTF